MAMVMRSFKLRTGRTLAVLAIALLLCSTQARFFAPHIRSGRIARPTTTAHDAPLVLAIVGNITELTTHYIADIGANNSIACKHGPAECAGDKEQLCVLKYTQQQPGHPFWQFLMCQDKQFAHIGDPSLVDHCLQQAGVDSQTAALISECISGTEGEELLLASAELTKGRDVQKSCTIYIDHKPRCIADSGTWYDCPGGSEVADFVETICTASFNTTGMLPLECSGSAAAAIAQQ